MLKYIGKGDHIPNIPARDLNEEEVKQFGKDFLLKTGLYVEDNPKPKLNKLNEKETKQ